MCPDDDVTVILMALEKVAAPIRVTDTYPAAGATFPCTHRIFAGFPRGNAGRNAISRAAKAVIVCIKSFGSDVRGIKDHLHLLLLLLLQHSSLQNTWMMRCGF